MGKTRRGFLKIVGGTGVIVAASAGGFAATRTPTKALAPWDLAGGSSYADVRMRALSYAILAPNPHNRQPWMVDLDVPGEATLYVDMDKMLPETDPPNRQITIGLGCFLELLRMAAAEEGMLASITPFPEGAGEDLLDGRPVAHIQFTEGSANPDPLFAHVLERRSLKEPYDTARVVSAETLSSIRSVTDEAVGSGQVSEQDRIAMLRDLTWRAWEIEIITPHTFQESIDLMRIGKAEINANPDGIDLGGFFLETLALTGQLNRETLADPTSIAFKQGLDMGRAQMESAMGYVWLMTQTNTRLDQLNAGRNWLRMNLKATSLGVGLQPLSQSIQEYPEMDALFAEIHEALGVDLEAGARVQMFGRLGYAPLPGRTPRWKIEEKVL